MFKHRPNTLHKIGDKHIWESRSTAINAIIFALNEDDIHVLVEKRSDTMPDAPGLHVVPCGYIDYDETGWNALRREVYEETGILIDDYKNKMIYDNGKEPFYVITEPDAFHQNIVLCYTIVFDFEGQKLPDVESYRNSEINGVEWVPLKKINSAKFNWAFNHNKIIKLAIDKYRY